MVYIYDYNVPDSGFEEYSTNLKNASNLVHVQKAFWIKNKNITATPLILTFREKKNTQISQHPRRTSQNQGIRIP